MGAVCTQLSIIERWRHAKVPVDEMAHVLKRNYFCDESMPKHDGYYGTAAQMMSLTAISSATGKVI